MSPKPSVSASLDRDTLPECPDVLDDEAREEWDRVIVELDAKGVLDRLDRAMLAAYCAAWSTWSACQREITDKGLIGKNKSGATVQNPYLSVAAQALRQMHELGSDLGLSPLARTKLKTGRVRPTAPELVDDPPFEAPNRLKLYRPTTKLKQTG